jgi:hypothetical protein
MQTSPMMLLFAGLLTGLLATPANGREGTERFTFAEYRIEGFELEAHTEWEAVGAPSVKKIGCNGSNNDVSFYINQAGGIEGLWSGFLMDPDEHGHRAHGRVLGDGLWLYVDGKRYEFRSIGAPEDQFLNYPYPPVEPHDIILLWRGTHSIRQSDTEPFRPLSSIYEKMVNTKKLAWGIKDPDSTVSDRGPKLGSKRRYRIDNTGLKQAVEWCRRQVASPAARTLPEAELARLLGK